MFDLCLSLGYKHPDDMLDELSARQLMDWQLYANQVGLPPRRDDIHYGMLMALLHNCNRTDKTPPAKPKDYMPYHEEPPLTAEQFVASWQHCIAGINAFQNAQK